MNRHRVKAAALDCVSKFRATRFVLKNVVNDIIKLRKLNSSERKILFDLVFDFTREIFLFNRFLQESMAFSSSLSTNQKDMALLEILLDHKIGPSQDKTDDLDQAYQKWLAAHCAERALVALGPLIAGELKGDYGQDAAVIAAGLLRRPKKYLAIDLRYVTAQEVGAALTHNGVDHFFHPLLPRAIGVDQQIDIDSLPSSMRGHIWFMDAGSQIIAELINPKPHERVLDLCAGEGNKARYISAKGGDYTAVDISESRLGWAQKRLKAEKVTFVVADGRHAPLPANSFDWVLLDAPCSGVGTLARCPDLALRLQMSDIKNSVLLQYQLLQSALSHLKPGGKLIYATCSLLKVENEKQIDRLLSENDHVKRISLNQLVCRDLQFADLELNKNSLTIFPHINDCDGFYFAILSK